MAPTTPGKPNQHAGKDVDVFVEIPRGSRAKYELDKASGHIRLDRVLFSSVHYPADYGFVMDTLARDGDPLDALVIVEEPTFPGCVVPARPIGTLFMKDGKGEDEKILAVPAGDPRFSHIHQLEDDAVELKGWHGVDTAWRVIEECRDRARG